MMKLQKVTFVLILKNTLETFFTICKVTLHISTFWSLKKKVQHFKSYRTYVALDLLAEFVGHLGIFLRASIFQLKDGFSFLIRKFLSLYQ